MGLKLMPLPEEPFINFAGMLSEQERLQALEAATVVVCPSPYESLSLIALEALAVGTPILCNARSDVLVDHCLRSNGGLFYRDRDEFVECLKLLVADERLRAAMGRSGREYVRKKLPMGRGARKTRQDDREAQIRDRANGVTKKEEGKKNRDCSSHLLHLRFTFFSSPHRHRHGLTLARRFVLDSRDSDRFRRGRMS